MITLRVQKKCYEIIFQIENLHTITFDNKQTPSDICFPSIIKFTKQNEKISTNSYIEKKYEYSAGLFLSCMIIII